MMWCRFCFGREDEGIFDYARRGPLLQMCTQVDCVFIQEAILCVILSVRKLFWKFNN